MYSSIRDYVSEGSKPNYDQLTKRFGDPKQVAATYVNEMETDELIARFKINGKTISIVFIAVVLLVVIRFCFNLASLHSFQRDVSGYAVVEVIEVERKMIDEGE